MEEAAEPPDWIEDVQDAEVRVKHVADAEFKFVVSAAIVMLTILVHVLKLELPKNNDKVHEKDREVECAVPDEENIDQHEQSRIQLAVLVCFVCPEPVLAEGPDVNYVVDQSEEEAEATDDMHVPHVDWEFCDEEEAAHALEEGDARVEQEDPVARAPHVITERVNNQVERLHDRVEDEVRNSNKHEMPEPAEVNAPLSPSIVLPFVGSQFTVHHFDFLTNAAGLISNPVPVIGDLVIHAPDKLLPTVGVVSSMGYTPGVPISLLMTNSGI